MRSTPTHKHAPNNQSMLGILVCLCEFEALPGARVDIHAALSRAQMWGGPSKVHTGPPPLMNENLLINGNLAVSARLGSIFT